VAAAPAEREWDETYRDDRPRRERRRDSLTVVDRGPRRRRGLGMRQRPAAWLVAFAVCVALLAVGRVTLSFAVVQKNMETEALVREQRALRSENARLQEQLAGLMATPRLRELAMERFGLVPAQNVIYLDGVTAGGAAAHDAAGGAGSDASSSSASAAGDPGTRSADSGGR
jgi:cell division protein FtsL